ncbi:unnamed protein product [Adineta steineri]|uniref:Apple domain-containing protein n=1 Tax=Adineta steineri TaxID=433720 RepID=A0A815INU8_9BILA|nr:unnamed protein product [Adineta steineri]CAF1603279.1 unnamed protein product [Adineta steineri]
MRSFTIVVVIMALVAIVAKHSSVATHDSYSQALRRRLNGYNDDEREQYNMFLRRVAQQLADDKDDDESFRATMRKRVDSVSNDGTILGIGTNYKLYTRATLNSDWIQVPNTMGEVIAVTQLHDGTILGIGQDYKLWTRATLNSDWIQVPNTMGAVIGVTQLQDGTILGIGTNDKLYTRATLNSDWIQVPNTMGAVIGVTQLQDGTILGIGTNNKLYTRATLNSDWIEVQNTMGAVIAVTQLHNGTILGIGTNNKLYTRATLNSDWIEVPNTMGAVIGITQLNYPTISATPTSKAATNTASKAATATTTAHLSTSSRCTEIVIGKDNYGGDMDATHPAQVHSPAACAALCEQYLDCTAWTFNVQSGKCWTKDKTTSVNASPDAITGTCKKSSK